MLRTLCFVAVSQRVYVPTSNDDDGYDDDSYDGDDDVYDHCDRESEL